MHAGCAVSPCKANCIIVLGNSGNGKSSAVWELLKLGYDYCSNDRIFVGRHSSDFEVIGYPTAMRLGYGLVRKNIQYIENVRELSRACGDHANILDGLGKSWGDKAKLELSPAEVCNVFSCSHIQDACITNLLVVSMKPGNAETVLKPVKWEDVRSIVDNNTYMNDPDYVESYIPPECLVSSRFSNCSSNLEHFKTCVSGRIHMVSGGIKGLSNELRQYIDSY